MPNKHRRVGDGGGGTKQSHSLECRLTPWIMGRGEGAGIPKMLACGRGKLTPPEHPPGTLLAVSAGSILVYEEVFPVMMQDLPCSEVPAGDPANSASRSAPPPGIETETAATPECAA